MQRHTPHASRDKRLFVSRSLGAGRAGATAVEIH
jgi:hypothetical protein